MDEDDMLLLWLSLFKAETEEELEKIKEMEVPVMSQAINAYYTITASSEFREKERICGKQDMTRHRHCTMPGRKGILKLPKNYLKGIDQLMKL